MMRRIIYCAFILSSPNKTSNLDSMVESMVNLILNSEKCIYMYIYNSAMLIKYFDALSVEKSLRQIENRRCILPPASTTLSHAVLNKYITHIWHLKHKNSSLQSNNQHFLFIYYKTSYCPKTTPFPLLGIVDSITAGDSMQSRQWLISRMQVEVSHAR